MSREIQCLYCTRKVGEIRDARLIKNLAYICPDCQKTLEYMMQNPQLIPNYKPVPPEKYDWKRF